MISAIVCRKISACEKRRHRPRYIRERDKYKFLPLNVAYAALIFTKCVYIRAPTFAIRSRDARRGRKSRDPSETLSSRRGSAAKNKPRIFRKPSRDTSETTTTRATAAEARGKGRPLAFPHNPEWNYISQQKSKLSKRVARAAPPRDLDPIRRR